MARIVRLTVFALLLALLALPALSAPEQPTRPGNLLSGPSALAHVFTAMHYGDYAAYYLAAFYGVDPSGPA